MGCIEQDIACNLAVQLLLLRVQIRHICRGHGGDQRSHRALLQVTGIGFAGWVATMLSR